MKSTKKLTQEQAISTLKKLHPTLNFDEFIYKNNRTKSIVIHPDGKKYLLSYKHLIRGVTSNYNKTTEDVVKEFVLKFGSYCDYSKVVYRGATSNVVIICPEHGEFTTTPNRYLSISQYPCPKCGLKARSISQSDTLESFIKKARVIQGDLYDYSKSIYIDNKTNIEIIHGDHSFWQRPDGHLHKGYGCPFCNNTGISKQEEELVEFIRSLGVEVFTKDRGIIKPLELDIVIPSHNLAIEYNGLYYHSEAFQKDKNYHLIKTNLCQKEKFKLLHIFEDEWVCKKEIVKSRIKHILGLATKKLFARNLDIKIVSKEDTKCFLDDTHIQGHTATFSHSYGLFELSELVAVMTFCKNRFSGENSVELLRFSSKYSVVGGFSKLLRHFLRDNPTVQSVISYSDKRWSQGEVYLKNRFTNIGTSEPGYDYFGNGNNRRYNRQCFMKHKLPKILKKYDPILTEVENCKNNGFYRIWNCGMDKWELRISN